jgi:hypothetical protein
MGGLILGQRKPETGFFQPKSASSSYFGLALLHFSREKMGTRMTPGRAAGLDG